VDEEGAVTVDWVVLCAAIVGLTVLIATSMQEGTVDLADGIAGYMANWDFN